MGWANTPAVYVEKRYYEAYRDRDISVSRERERQMTLMPCSGYTVTPPFLTRLPIHGLAKITRPGLGVFATGAASTHAAAQVIPSGMEDDVSALSTVDLLS
jgi:hypothetical protein